MQASWEAEIKFLEKSIGEAFRKTLNSELHKA